MAEEMNGSPSVVLPKSTVADEIDKLLSDQKKVKDERKRVSSELKNAQRRQKRLKHRARLLDTDDLLRVIAIRSQEDAKKAEKAAAAAAADAAKGGTA